MVLTPWGRGEELRARMLDSGPRASAEEAAENQRQRLFGAMVASCAEKGYEGTTVADLLQLAGMSRRDFYKHFADREACFLATLDELFRMTGLTVRNRLESEGSWEERAQASLEVFIKLVIAQPAAARLCLVEAYTVGDAALERLDAATRTFQALVRATLGERPGHEAMPSEISDAMVGAMRKLIHSRLHRGTEAELAGIAPTLLELALAYVPPPEQLRARPRRRARANSGPAERSDWARQAEADDSAERIIRATMELVAAHGFQAVRIGEIAERAGVSLSTFYDTFEGKAEAFDAALYAGRTRLIGVAMPAYKRARSWPEAMRELTAASYAFLASEPEFAHLVTSSVLGAGSEALERHEIAMQSAQWPLKDGEKLFEAGLGALEIEAVMLTCYSLMCEWIQNKGAEDLPRATPLATYLALSPFIGPGDAAKVANGGRYPTAAPPRS